MVVFQLVAKNYHLDPVQLFFDSKKYSLSNI